MKADLSYGIENNLDSFINREVGRRMSNNGGVRVTKKDIIKEIAEHCELTWDGANRIKRNLALPSLPVALKIAEYFGVNVETIFKLN